MAGIIKKVLPSQFGGVGSFCVVSRVKIKHFLEKKGFCVMCNQMIDLIMQLMKISAINVCF